MAEIVFATSIVRGKEDLERETREEMAGARRDEYEAALKDAGITRQAVWHQQMPASSPSSTTREPMPKLSSALSRLMRVSGSCSRCRKHMDVGSRIHLFRSS